MRILITGGAGFLGSHLCERLLNEGNEVICLDNYFTGRKRNVAHLLSNPYFELVRHDVTEPFKFEVDRIYNLACPASPPHYQHNPIKTIKTSVLGAIHTLGLAKRIGARAFQASTSEVYGDPEIHLGQLRKALLRNYHRQNGVDIRVVRIFNTYGPRMLPDDGRVVSNFIVQALRGEDLTIYGDGLQTRSFCYADDLIDGFIRLMEKEGITGPVNIGNPGEFTMLELAELVLKKIGGKSKLTFMPLPGDDPKQRRPDITLARKELGWEPTVNLEDGLDPTIAYFRKLLAEV